jgi:hypothetical protein
MWSSESGIGSLSAGNKKRGLAAVAARTPVAVERSDRLEIVWRMKSSAYR